MCGVNSNEETRLFASDYRGLDERARELLEDYSTVEELWRFAWEITAQETFVTNRQAQIRNETPQDGREEQAAEILEEIQTRSLEDIPQWFLAELLQAVQDDFAALACSDEGFSLRLHDVSRNVNALKFLTDAVQYTGDPPFVSEGTPYDHRTFRLSGGNPDADGRTILVVDIHT